jgi:hypothetical protein
MFIKRKFYPLIPFFIYAFLLFILFVFFRVELWGNWLNWRGDPSEIKETGFQLLKAIKLSRKNHFCLEKKDDQIVREREELLMERIGEDKIFIAIDWYNNEAIAPDFILELESVIKTLGGDRFFVSIYENG